MGRILPTLPPDITQGATLQGNEYGWIISLFPDAVVAAKKYNYACLGGQFQFRLPDGGTCEMYWLSADSTNRANEEPWQDFSCRSCDEVLERFHALVSKTDFREQASNWPRVSDVIIEGLNHNSLLVFVAYFVSELEFSNLKLNI